MKHWSVVSGIVLCAAVGSGVWWWRGRNESKPQYRTVTVEQGSLVQSVRATGTVKPLRLVEVGTQVNGPIEKLYVDFNNEVKAGELVAQIDPTVYKARLAQEQANLLQSEASVEQSRARLDQAEKNLVRARELARRDMISQADLDQAVAERDTLAAQLKVAQASVAQARASLQMAEANLGYTVIRSPVDGVVIERSVSEGETVVASMTAKTLFTIATDLRQIEIEASIPEADIGSIRQGQGVTFTVDAYGETFTGNVAQIRLSAKTAQNIVTYPVIIRAENRECRLFPGMTANITCEVARREDVLKVPNAALRFRMNNSVAAEGAVKGKAKEKGPGRGQRIWVLRSPDASPESVRVTPGITDGMHTELKEAVGIRAGDTVVVGTNAVQSGSTDVVNPFTPQMPRRRQR